MVVNIDENFPVQGIFSSFAQTLKARAVRRDHAVKFFARLGSLQKAIGIEKFIFVGNWVFVPARNFFPLVAQSDTQGKLGTHTIAIRTDMPDDAKRFMLADGFENAVNDLGIRIHY